MDPTTIEQNRLYGDLAWLWPLLSPPEDYAKEARHWRDALRSRLGPGRHHLLELGAGAGHALSHLTRDFDATAVDVSHAMLRHSMKLNPGVEHHVGDMRSVRLHKRFDAVLAHDAIGYMLSVEDLRAAFATAVAHLEPGGVFITSPDYYRETFQDPRLYTVTRSDGETELTYVELDYDPDPEDTSFETLAVYFIRQQGRPRLELDRHILGLFPRQTWQDLMAEAGFRVEPWSCEQGIDPRQGELLLGTLL